MKKIIIALVSIVALASCGGGDTASDAAATPKKDSIVNPVCIYSYDSAATEIGFGAFKTTARKEVKGSFVSFEISGTKESDTLLNVFSNATFSINIQGLGTGDISRDFKIKKFFSALKGTSVITGSVKSVDKDSSKITLLIKLNEIEKDLVLTYTINGDEIVLNGSLNLIDFSAEKALFGLNKACEDLHKGADGVSKTWPDVNIYLSTKLKNSCK
ncbi:MAG: YceI family protein [Bacteroidetes bacterium]|nr:YceI family protein [Bacteroidota bacterium]